MFRKGKGKFFERLIQRERENALYGAKFEGQNVRIQGMSEIITDFEESEFHCVVGDGYVLIDNKNSSKLGSMAIEITISEVESVDGEKKFKFKLKHPRTYR